MKRTPKNGGEKRDAVFRFRVSPAEKEIIRQHAAREGMSLSDYIRKKIEEYSSGLDRHALIRLTAEMGKQGSNLNQIAKGMNIAAKTGNAPKVEPESIRHSLEEVSRLCGELNKIIKHGRGRKNQG